MTKKLKMARRFIATGVLSAFVFIGIASSSAQELSLSEEDMQYGAGKANITVDGDMSDWAGQPVKTAIPFKTGTGAGDGELVLFQNWGAGTWDGPEDHTSAVSFAWDVDNLYLGVVVTDDEHQNSNNAWNGDSIQMVFANAAQDTVTFLYNYALNMDGELVLHEEQGPGETEFAIVRDDDAKTTSYEIKFPASSLELDALEVGLQFGIGVCVNEGDPDHPGQTGWDGWGPHAAVTGGKHPEMTGLVTLIEDAREGGGPLVPDLIAYWDFDDVNNIVDLVAGLEGEVMGEVEPATGHLGGAVDLGSDQNWIKVDAEESGWLAPASDADQLSVSLWQKLNVVRNSSTFWFRAEAAGSNARNFQAHIPWGNNSIFFDTSGCCGATQRISLGAADIDFLEWHHFVFIKDGENKSIWVDGQLWHEGVNSGTLFDDWTYLAIGSSGTGDYAAAILDDFGVWSRAITADEIALIYNGGLGNPLMTDALSAGANTIAVEIHQASGSSSDIRFDMMLRGETSQGGGDNVSDPLFFAEPAILRTRSYNTGNKEWSALTEAFFTIEGATVDASNLVVSELHYHPANPTTPAELAESSDRDDFEFLEFLNIGRATLDLTGIRFAAGINFAFPDNTVLKAGKRLLLIRNRAAFEARYGSIEGIQSFEYTGRLNNDGEQLLITANGPNPVHDFTYNDQLPWPAEADGDGASLILSNPAAEPPHGEPANWTASRHLGGSPGAAEPAGITYAAWAALNGIQGESNDDDDGDGLSNYWEFLFGSRPDLASDTPVFGLTVRSIDVDGVVDDYLFLTFRKNLNANASLTVEASSDLITWSPDPAMIKPVSKADNGDGTATVTFRFARPIGQGQSQAFVRLRGN